MNRSGQYIQIYERGERFCWRVKNSDGETLEFGQNAGTLLRTLCIHEAERVHPDLPIFEQEKQPV